MDDIMRQNPELMAQFQNAAMNSMNQTNPGFGQFMGGVMGGPMGGPMGGSMPPMGAPPMPSREMRHNPPHMPPSRSRPDVAASRQAEFSDTVNMRDTYDKVNISSRPEMKGPTEIGDLLSGLKTKKINIKQKDTNSVVSISELNEMKADMEKPKKSRRKPKSERNTISLNFN